MTKYTGPHDPPGKPMEGTYKAEDVTNDDETVTQVWKWEASDV
jgi:hypothetical protein